LPRLGNGKIDYTRLRAQLLAPPEAAAPVQNGLKAIFSKAFIRYFIDEALELIGLMDGNHRSVQGLFSAVLGVQVEPSDSFHGLGGDSLSYVEVCIALENYLGYLPADWERMSLGDLEVLKHDESHF
jgi:hypothetical protein